MIFIPTDQWITAKPEVFSTPGARSPEAYVRCIEQWQVPTHARYKRNAAGYTMCNIFTQDVALSMKVPCPHWVDKTSKDPLAIGPTGLPVQLDNREEMSGNGICLWLQTHGVQRYGWEMVTPEGAAQAASIGFMTVVTWYNPGGIGHIGVIRPSVFPNVRIAQAGGSNFLNGSIGNGFGTNPNVLAHLVYLTNPI